MYEPPDARLCPWFAATRFRICIVNSTNRARSQCHFFAATHGFFVDFREVPDIAAAVIKVADNIGVHGVFVTAPAAYRDALSFLVSRIGAIVMCVGLAPKDSVSVGGDPNALIFKNATIRGTLVGSCRDVAAALDFAHRGQLKQICKVYPIDRLPEAVEKLRKGQVAGRIVVKFDLID